MEDIRVYDFDFQLLCIEHNISSCYWTLFYNDIGTFEGTFPLASPLTKVLFSHKYLFLTQGDKQAIITGKKADGMLYVYGKTPNWILSRRVMPAFTTDDLEDASYDKVEEYVLKTGFSDIYETHFTFSNQAEGVSDDTPFSRRAPSPVSQVICDRIKDLGLGHQVRLDIKKKRWAFSIYKGKPVSRIISQENRTFFEVALLEDLQNYYTAGYYNKELQSLGEWNPYTAVPQANSAKYGAYYTISYEEGQTQKQGYPKGDYLVCDNETAGTWQVYASLPQLSAYLAGEETGIYRWDTVFSCGTLSEAEDALFKKKHVKNITGTTANLSYGKDICLGDVVTVQITKGDLKETLSRRVIGVEVWYESGNCGEKFIFEEDANGISI